MSNRTRLLTAAFGVGILMLVTVHGQQNAKGGTLTPMDYIQINQLTNRYAYAVDTGADQGGMYAGLFAPDGKFLQRGGVVHTGRESLASLGYRTARGPQSVFHYLMSHAIEPTPDGNARGKEELVQFTIGDNGQPSTVFGGGHYDDIYERTADGWRFKQRQFIPSQSGYELTIPTTDVPEQRRISTAPVTSTTMTAADYIEIQQLLARYPYALDTGQRKGQMWVDLFTKDGKFGTSQGQEALLKIAWQHRPGQGPSYSRNFPQSVVITPTAEGATGKMLTYVIDVGEGQGKPSPILHGDHYEDTYVRTSDGWRIKHRTVYTKKSGPDAGADLPPLKIPVRVPAPAGSNGPKHNGLSVEDYLDIQQLITTYPMALDTGAGEGYVFADLFTPDGVFMADTVNHQGREDLKKFAWQHRPGQGPLYVRNYSTNPWIEASPEGATGKVYALVLDLGENGEPNRIIGGGHYEDVYARTAQGWRIKKRQFIPSKTEPPARQSR
jgi:SnoaL-like domain